MNDTAIAKGKDKMMRRETVLRGCMVLTVATTGELPGGRAVTCG